MFNVVLKDISLDIYDKLLEAKIEADEKSPTLTIEDYRAEKHLQKPTMQKFLYSNAFRFIIFIPLFVILTENAWDVATGNSFSFGYPYKENQTEKGEINEQWRSAKIFSTQELFKSINQS